MGNRGKVVGSSLEKSWEIIKKEWEGRGKSSGKFVGKSTGTAAGKLP